MEQVYRIGIDHGYGNIKTARHIFESGVIERERASELARMTVEYEGKFYEIGDVQPRDKNTLYLMKRGWLKMLDILINEKPVQCSRELLIAMKQEAKAKALVAETEKDMEIFHSIDSKLSCFLDAIDRHHLSHLPKGKTEDRELPEFISPEERKGLSKLYHFPEREVMAVADRSPRYFEAIGR